MLTTLFWCVYFLFSFVWAVLTGVALIVASIILGKYPYDYYHDHYKKLPKRFTILTPFLDDVRTSPVFLYWLLMNMPIVGTLMVISRVFSVFFVPLVLTPMFKASATWVTTLVDPYLEE